MTDVKNSFPRLAFSLTSAESTSDLLILGTEAEDMGFDEIWTAEIPGVDPLLLSSMLLRETHKIAVGVGVVAMAARSATSLSITAGMISNLTPRRFRLGIGTSSPFINKRWHGVEIGSPVAAIERYLNHVRMLLGGETYTVKPYQVRLPATYETPPPLYLGALGPEMIRLSNKFADGIVTVFASHKWLSGVRDGLTSDERKIPSELDIVTRVFLPIPGDDPAAISAVKKIVAQYSTVPSYAAHFSRMGYAEQIEVVATHQASRRFEDAVNAIPDELLADIAPLGSIHDQIKWLTNLTRAGSGSVALAFVTSAGHQFYANRGPSPRQIREYLQLLVNAWRSHIGGQHDQNR